jgi:predicted nuclease of predicted toxin-antitoxin system
MRVLLDNNVNYRFGRLLEGHDVTHVQDIGWERLLNGDLLAAAKTAGYQVLITADKSMQYEQSMKGRRIGVVVLGSRRITLKHIAPLAGQVSATLDDLHEGTVINVGLRS